ncbi:hypothetical protein SAMN04489812_0945 [Microlunatus soli]|uniref:Uncharacterized protein n=1 Tax=Microlunatus soli TaxID=630515 RepID=A0A1H1PLX8_9ACTN|nr:hypothetical protein SAMN04489812_0945 [Microlunatus soli]
MNDVTRIDCAGCPVGDGAVAAHAETSPSVQETGPTEPESVIGGRSHSCAECVVSLLLDVPSGPSGLATVHGPTGASRRPVPWASEGAGRAVFDVEIGPQVGHECDTGHVVGIRTRNCQ